MAKSASRTSPKDKTASEGSEPGERKQKKQPSPPQPAVIQHPHQEEDPHLGWFYRPHTLTLLVCTGLILVYAAFNRDETQNTVDNTKYGLLAGCLVFLLFSMLQMKDGLFIRPHPAVWRVAMGVSVLYWMGLVYLLFQSLHDAQQLMVHFDPSLGKPLPERSYAEDCRLYTPEDPNTPFRNLWATLNDEFVLAHLLGWWLKMLVVRDVYLLWVLSILFEVMEYTFEDMLLNFRECWWDHFILDVLVCNGLGILLGSWTLQLFKMKHYNWTGAPPHGKLSMLKKAVSVFTPQMEPYDWHVLSSPKRFFYLLALLVCFELVELNAFFLKALLWIPPPHWINLTRLVIWFFLSLPAFREFYQFLTDKTCKRFGTMAWLALAVMGTESLIVLKFRKVFPLSFPTHMIWGWAIFFILFAVWVVFFFFNPTAPPSTVAQRRKRR